MHKTKFLAGSPYHLEFVLGLDLAGRAAQGCLTHLLLNQPPICNSYCRRCFMPDDRRNSVVDPLSLAESCRVIREARDVGIVCLEISGEGEPLLSGNLDGIVRCAHECGMITTVITNGHALTDDRIQFFFDHNVTLVVSLFSVDKSQYEADNGLRGSHEKVMRKLRTAARVFRSGRSVVRETRVFRMAVHATAQSDNVRQLAAIREFCIAEDIFFSLAPLARVGGGLSMQEMMLSPEEKRELDSLGDNSIILSSTSAREVGREVCGTCLYGLNISYNGNVLLDAHAGYEMEGRLGSVRTSTVADLVERQRQFAPFIFHQITGFCPVRDPEWTAFVRDVKSIPGERENGVENGVENGCQSDQMPICSIRQTETSIMASK